MDRDKPATSMRTGAGMFAHASPGTSGRHIAEELLWYDRIRFSNQLITSCVDLLRISDQRFASRCLSHREYRWIVNDDWC